MFSWFQRKPSDLIIKQSPDLLLTPQQKFLQDLSEVLSTFTAQMMELPLSEKWSTYDKRVWKDFQLKQRGPIYGETLSLRYRQEIILQFINLQEAILPSLYVNALTVPIRSDIKQAIQTLTTNISSLHNHLWMKQRKPDSYKKELQLTTEIRNDSSLLNDHISLIPLHNGNETLYLDEVIVEESEYHPNLVAYEHDMFPDLPEQAAYNEEIVVLYEDLKKDWEQLSELDVSTLSTETRYLLRKTVDDYVPQSFELYTKLAGFVKDNTQQQETDRALASQLSLIHEQIRNSQAHIFDDLKTAFMAHTTFLNDRNEMYKNDQTNDHALEGKPDK